MQTEDKILIYLSGEMPESQRLSFESEIESSQELKTMLEEYRDLFQAIEEDPIERPSLQLAHRFQQRLAAENKGKIVPLTLKWKKYMAAAASIVILVSAGILFGIQYNQKSIIALQTKELTAIKSQISTMLSDQSIPTRVNAMYVAQEYGSDNNALLELLIQSMKEDKSSHVRLAAVQAISGYEKDPLARAELINQLQNETDPFVKVAIIQSLSNMNESNAVHTFDQIIDDENTPKFIKDEAHKAKLELTKI